MSRAGIIAVVLAATARACVSTEADAAASDPNAALKPSKIALFCTEAGATVTGLNKICYYSCGKAEGAMMVLAYDRCPRWTLRSRLRQGDRQFGPNSHTN